MKFLSNLTPRLRADLAGLDLTPRSSIGNIERYLLRCRSFQIRRNSVLYGFSFSLLVDIHDWTEAKHDCKPYYQCISFCSVYLSPHQDPTVVLPKDIKKKKKSQGILFTGTNLSWLSAEPLYHKPIQKENNYMITSASLSFPISRWPETRWQIFDPRWSNWVKAPGFLPEKLQLGFQFIAIWSACKALWHTSSPMDTMD